MKFLLKFILLLLCLFSIILSDAADFYWVGGSGNWNDIAHWSTISGGQGGAGVPNSNQDNVIFDHNSFNSYSHSVKVSTNIEIKNFKSTAPYNFKLYSESPIQFHVNGNWEAGNRFRNRIQGKIIFAGNNSHTINSKARFYTPVVFDNAGEYQLLSDFISDETIYFKHGEFISNGKIIQGSSITVNDYNIVADLTNSDVVTDQFNYPNTHVSDHLVINNNTNFISDPGNIAIRGTNSCGSPLMTISTYLDTTYNGYGVTCNGASDGIVCITVIGGVGPFFINWLDPDATDGYYGTGAECYVGVDAGTYSVLVTDEGQGSSPFFVTCGTSQSVVEPGEISLITMLLTDPTCFNDCDGTATPVIFDDLPIVSYSWNNGNETTPTATQLCTGENSLTTIDANGCQFDTTFFILTPTPVLPNVTTTNVSCFGVCDGIAISNPSGGNGSPYAFAWSNGSNSPGPIADSITSLCAGNYSVTVTDFMGCPGTVNFTITQPPQIILSLVSQVNLVCNGICSGAINISTANGTPNYTYQWFDNLNNPVVGQTNEDATGMCAGTYYVQVTDANGCQDVSADITLTEPTAISIIPDASDIICFGQCSGTLSAIVSGGIPTYDFQWYNATTGLPVAGAINNPQGGMCAGNYFVEVTDNNGCIENSIPVVTINEPPEVILSVNSVDLLCNSDCIGTANASAVGGVGGFNFEWFQLPSTSLGTGNSIDSLCAGSYYGEVADANGCTDTALFNISEPDSLQIITEAASTVNCTGDCDGTTTFDVTGGTAPYTIEWFDAATGLSISQFGTTASNLCPGNYYAIATDANNCTIASDTLTVTQPNPLTVSITGNDISCFGLCDGSANLTISGGTPTYTINWSSGGSGNPLTGLCAGNYFADVTDANGCIATSSTVTITEPTQIISSIATTDVICNSDCNGTAIVTSAGGTPGYTYTWTSSANTTDTENNLCAGNYDVTIEDVNGCPGGTINFTINEPNPYSFIFDITDPLCSGNCNGTATVNALTGEGGTYIFSWTSSANTTNSESNLCDGAYTLTITDQNGCDTIVDFSITEPTTLTLTPAFADPTCLTACNGTASANPVGGTPPYSFVWVNTTTSTTLATTTDTIQNLCEGDYQVTVTDANGCTGIATYTLTDPPGMTATTTPTAAACGTACDGTVDVSVVGGSAPFTISWIDATTGTPIGQSSDPAINLCAGNYYAVISDSSGCSVNSDTAIVTQAIVISGTLTENDPTCFGSCNGSIDLTPAGGDLPYSFEWFDQNTNTQIGQTSEDAVGLCDGDYYVIVTDSNGCESPPILASLTEPTQILVSITGTDASCNGSCDGTGTSTVSGGIPSYTYNWINSSTGAAIGQSTANASGLCAGTYELDVTDNSGCLITSNAIVVDEPNPMSTNLSVVDAICSAGCNGSATLSVSGGSTPYTFTWSSSGNTTGTESGLCAGNYSVSVTDNSGCSIGPILFTISEPSLLTGVTTDAVLLCNGDCNGSVSVTASGGVGPFTYLWSNNQTTPVISNLCAGNYSVVITDANGCSTPSLSSTVTEPPAISVTSVTSTDALCGGSCDGTATITVSGGAGTFTYQWNDPLNQTTQTAVSLCAGNYTVIATDTNGCSTTPQPVTVNEPNALTVSVTTVDESCFNTCNGTATAVISGGTGATTVQWDDPNIQTTNPATALCGGTYTVDVTDANGCVASASGTIGSAVDLTATVSSTDAQCGQCDGTATITPSGGTGTLDILWDANAASQTTSTASSLCAGTYQVTVTDDNGCTQTFSAAVNNPNGEVITVSSTDASCQGVCDGTATVSFVCSTPNCTIQWNDPGNQTTNTATGLCEGSYAVSVTNGAGCVSAAVVDVIEPQNIQVNAASTDVVCNGDCNGTASTNPSGGDGNYSWSWSPGGQSTPAAVNLCAGTYDVTVTDGNGCIGTASVIVNDSPILTVSVSASDASCFGVCDGIATAFPLGGNPPYTYQWDDPSSQTTQSATGLCAGTYNVTVVDANGCTFGPLTVTIDEPTQITGNISGNSVNCNGDCNGTATLNVSGGNSPFTYQWDDPLSQTTATANNLCSGNYNVIATDVNGCSTAPFTISLVEPDSLLLSVTVTDALCRNICNGQADAVITGGTLPYSIQWDDPLSQTTSTAFNLCSGNYSIDVTDANGCLQTANITVTAPDLLEANITVSDVTCFDLCDGSSDVAPTGGTAPYSILWSDGSTNTSLASLCPGNYSVDVTDANGCNTSEVFVIEEPTEIIANYNFANSQCGMCTGSVAVTPSGGVPSYTYLWGASAGGGTTPNAANLCAGVYSVDITDATGCSVTVGVSISDNNAETVSLTITDASCFGVCDGTITAVTPCVNGPCAFEWYDGTGTSFSTGNPVSGLCADDYFVEVTNANGCITVEDGTLNEQPEIEGNGIITDPLCGNVCDGTVALTPTGGNGTFTYLWSNSQTTQTSTGLCGGNVDVDITSGGCTIAETYFINQPVTINATAAVTNPQCNGDCDGSADLTVTDGVSPYSFQWDDGNNQTTQAAINLCAGNYNATITDANGCTEIIPVSIITPTAITATLTSTDIDCFGNCNGTATVNPSGGVTPYTIQWDDPGLQTTTTATSLCVGTYNVVITDSTLCSSAPLSITIIDNALLSVSAVTTPVICNSFCDGSITITASGGNGAYQYSIDNGGSFSGSNVFSNVCGGNYDVLVVDGNGCLGTVTVNVNEPSALSGTIDEFNATCNVNNGSANAIPTGGTPGYTYVWMDISLNPIGQNTQAATNLGAGIYNVLITDANGCTTTLTGTINNFNAPTITLFAVTPPTCNSDCNGSVDMDVTDGTPNYSYLWFAGGETTQDLTNVCAGNYILEVTDAAGCISFGNASLSEPAPIDATFSVTDALCGLCDGSAIVTPSGGTGGYTILWTNADSGTNADSLCGGTYGTQITDANGCSAMINVGVSNTSGSSATFVSTNVTCFGLCDGTADVSPVGGTAPYTFYWVHDGTTNSSVSGLCEGTYFCEVTDANNCVFVSEISINGATQITDSTVITPADCGVCNGGLQIFAVGGNGPFSYLWDANAGNSPNQTVSNLCEGFYSVTVTDGNGCTGSFGYFVNGKNAPAISMSTTDALCGGDCNASATVAISGGVGPFNQTWLDATGTDLGLSGTSISNMCAGDYFIEVTDQTTGCLIGMNFTIDEPNALQFSLPFLQNNSCFASCDGILTAIAIEGTLPYTFSWDDPSNSTTANIDSLCAGTFNVTITDANGCTDTQSATITEPAEITFAFAVTDASCTTVADGAIDATVAGGTGGFVYSWSGPNGFTANTEDIGTIFTGTYYLSVTDSNGCVQTDSAFVNATIVVVADAGNDTTICGNVSVFTVNGNGGITYEWYDTTGTLLASTQSYSFVPASSGTTTLILVAANGLCVNSDTINITINPVPNADAGPDIFSVAGIPIQIGGSPTGPSGSTILWTPSNGIDDTTAFNPNATIDTTTTYIVTVIDTNGCRNTDTMIVEILPPIFIPNGFSPNGDGPNDFWEIDFIEYFPDCQVEVYNRWGQMLFISVGYQIPWDGKYQGKEVPVGTYYYVINLNHPLFPDAYTGPLTILR